MAADPLALQAPTTPPAPSAKRRGRVLAPLRRARGVPRWLLIGGITVTAFFVVLALLAPWIAPYDFDQYRDADARFPKLEGPDGTHLFGTTVQSLDVLSRTVYGARTALEVVALAVVFSVVVGVPLGLISGYRGGWLDRVLVLFMDALFAFPYLLLAIVIAFILSDTWIGGGVWTAAIAITAVYIPQYFRVVRASTLSAREATYVEAARAIGAKPRTIVMRYLFSNVVHSVPVIATLNAADAILTLAGLGFLGYGIQPTEAAEWGYDLQRAISDAGAGIWWTALFPGLAITVLVVALTLVGEGLNEIINPTLRRRIVTTVMMPDDTDDGSTPTRRTTEEVGP
ncbi:ABC transporter permease [Motilibacter aurantiacus]|uniref:ABC transporter permease n=1 Tax=Motilibacter aurantiacus TaxID=2714955 RepID=UPI00140ABA87|nr:ABC transporter permease [Motilibacter aurantiacus]NHC47249.1 ABC transporter permease [Motilibacter aurantiacus]